MCTCTQYIVVVVVVVVVVSGIVKRRAVKITLTCFNSFHIFVCCSFSLFLCNCMYVCNVIVVVVVVTNTTVESLR